MVIKKEGRKELPTFLFKTFVSTLLFNIGDECGWSVQTCLSALWSNPYRHNNSIQVSFYSAFDNIGLYQGSLKGSTDKKRCMNYKGYTVIHKKNQG